MCGHAAHVLRTGIAPTPETRAETAGRRPARSLRRTANCRPAGPWSGLKWVRGRQLQPPRRLIAYAGMGHVRAPRAASEACREAVGVGAGGGAARAPGDETDAVRIRKRVRLQDGGRVVGLPR